MLLLALPIELLLICVSRLKIRDLGRLSLTNRTLNRLVTPLLIRRGGTDEVLVYAAQKGFLNLARDALSLGAAPDERDCHHDRPVLHWAAMRGHHAVVKLLLEHGANADQKTRCGWTALHWAVATHVRHSEKLTGVLYGSAVVDECHTRWDYEDKTSLWGFCHRPTDESSDEDEDFNTDDENPRISKQPTRAVKSLPRVPHAGHEKVVSLLFEHGADIDAQEEEGKTALCLAVQLGQPAMVKLLLERGADIRLGSVSWLPSLAPGTTQEAIFNFLMQWDSRDDTLSIPDAELGTTLLKVAASCNEEVLKFLLARGVDVTTEHYLNGVNALHIAAAEDHKGIVNILLDAGLDINLRDRLGCTALHHSKSLEMLTHLLGHGANIAAKDYGSQTPLHAMARLNAEPADLECASFLLSKGANSDSRDHLGRTPLHRAVISGKLEITKLLLQYGASTAIHDRQDLTPLHWAAMAQRRDIVEFLVHAGADIAVRSSKGRTLLHEVIRHWTVVVRAPHQEETVWFEQRGMGFYQGGGSNGGLCRRGWARWHRMVELLVKLGLDVAAVDDAGVGLRDAASAVGWSGMRMVLEDFIDVRPCQ